MEVVLVIAVFVGAAGVVLPILSAELQDSKITRAIDDTSRIAGAFSAATRLLGNTPAADSPGTAAAALLTSGAVPGGLPLGKNQKFFEILANAADEASARGAVNPILGDTGADPWGRAYVVIVPCKESKDHCWALSAGRDGILQTSEKDEMIRGDDIGVCVH